MKRKNFILPIAMILLATACDIVDVPIEEPIIAETDSYPLIDSTALNDSLRMVIVEEFTGHKCSFCPGNTIQLLALQKEHKENILIISVHAGTTFAKPEPPDYPTDFNTEYGTALHDFYQIATFAYPSALVNRAIIDGEEVFPSHVKWKDAINASLDQPATLALGVAADLTESDNKLSIRVSARAIEPIIGEHRLVLVCVEDSVIAPQKDVNSTEPGERVVDYAHRHVCRGKINAGNTFGEVFSNQIDAGEWAEAKVFTDLPSNVVNPDKVTIVALIINASTQEIIQSAEVHPHIIP
ncbi:MAG: Omp28-related outer membrane protein [Salibacteraceae bacterium]|jgi:hypothetical protein|nr:Omp28-related outer membrane protein [Salibacteraceae bacterium]MDP4687748.1 Omp28-related outer membrane protein [Salibacteraceae bacterium]MDP4762907.1 Omp28-related outer membrane protein [Salibacteraceae bacterium]MDP4843886.1 Omp28-related outer membrane protein [Salibacteraceae bacterium]MDP4934439.1 Omp28-related outer membrane protein [Salibacteraceae bacterium]